jgi:peptide/nickel transport system substrate-binding protein
MKRLRTWRRSLAGLTAVVVLVFAVGPAAADAPGPVAGDTAVVGLSTDPSCLNAYLTTCFGQPRVVTTPVLAGAYRQTPDFSYEPVLADRVKVEPESSTSWFKLTYHIEEDAVWSDGRPVNAHDFAFTAATLRDPANQIASRAGYELIRDTAVLDEKTVRFTFRRPFPAWKSLFPQVLPKHVLEGRDFDTVWNDAINDPLTGEPIGSGPFLLTAWTRGAQMTLTRNQRWWGEPAFLDAVRIRVVPLVTDQAQGLVNGELDLIYPGSPVPGLVGTPGIATQTTPGFLWEHVEVNHDSVTTPLLGEAWFREAVAYALDRRGAVTATWEAQAPGLRTVESLVYLGQQPEYRPDFRRYTYDPERVAEIMERRGCMLGTDGIWSCGDTKATVRFATTTGNALRLQFQVHLQERARAAGIQLVADNAPAGVLFGTRWPTGDFDLIMFSLPAGGDPGGRISLFGCEGSQNFTGYCSEPVTRLLEESDEETSESRRRSLVNDADAILVEDLPLIPLYQRPTFLYARATLKGPVDNSSDLGQALLWNVEEWSIG